MAPDTIRSPFLLSTAYLPPIQYISKFCTPAQVFIECNENYQKQSFRNRCYIYGANGKQCLVIPVKKLSGEKQPIRLVEIAYNYPWQKIHLNSIESAYRLSPFYEYYADEFEAHYKQKPDLLFDWNMTFLQHLLKLLGINSVPRMTEAYGSFARSSTDFRENIHPKPRLNKPDNNFMAPVYNQVFADRHGYLSNLSIIDLLFNEGPHTGEILRKSIKN